MHQRLLCIPVAILALALYSHAMCGGHDDRERKGQRVNVQMRLVHFDAALIDKLDRESEGGVQSSMLVQLWRDGKGKTIRTSSVSTIHGINAVIEDVNEIVYPVLDDAEKLVSGVKKSEIATETREVGVILNLTAVVNRNDESVELILMPENAALKPTPKNELSLDSDFRPRFASEYTTTQMVVKAGTTSVVSESLLEDGKTISVRLLTVVLENEDGTPYTKKAKPARKEGK